MVYQAVTRDELKNLRPEHILLNKAKIIIPPVGKNNQRTLTLNALQIIELQNYTEIIRPKLLKQSNVKSDKLFFGSRHCEGIRGILPYLFKTLNQINKEYEIKNIKQIRKSVIRNKLKTMNLREYFNHIPALGRKSSSFGLL